MQAAYSKNDNSHNEHCVITVRNVGNILCLSGASREGVGCLLYYDYGWAKAVELAVLCEGKVLMSLDADPKKCLLTPVANVDAAMQNVKIGFTITENEKWFWTPMRGKYPATPLDKYFYSKETKKAARLGLTPLPKDAPIRALLKEFKIDSTLPLTDRIYAAKNTLDKYGETGKAFMERFCWENVPQSGRGMEEDYEEEAKLAGCSIDEVSYIHMASMMAHLYFPQPEYDDAVPYSLFSLERDMD